MTVIGCTGHQNIPPVALVYVTSGIDFQLKQHRQTALIGACSLAVGADQLFARRVIALGGRLHAIIPCNDYDRTFTGHDQDAYQFLRRQTSEVDVLAFPAPSEDAFLAAGLRVVDLSDLLIAVWDGKEAQGKGGTADIVCYAREKNTPVVIVWPEGIGR